jgi:acyl dehydratase
VTAFEDLRVGDKRALGSFTFTAELIKEFARQFDPQPFHLDEEAGRASLFGGLAASGWHTAAIWMKLMVADQIREGVPTDRPTVGPSPGFREMKWPNPVLAGDTVSYFTEILELRTSASRPEWGILVSLNSGMNQRGQMVLSFIATAFISRTATYES